jgi:hypothetical protein
MKRAFGIGFGVMMVISAAVWLFGTLAGAVIPLFGGIRAERMGEIGFAAGMTGEPFAYGFGWLSKRLSQGKPERATGFSGGRRYGNKKSAA